jgi:hypothetical protein
MEPGNPLDGTWRSSGKDLEIILRGFGNTWKE